MSTVPTLPHLILDALRAHPVEAWLALGVVLNLINASLPATVRTGAFGRALHVLLDRVVILARRDAPGTLKWPIIAGSILRTVADSLSPPEPAAPMGAGPRPVVVPAAAPRETMAPPAPVAPTPLRAVTLTGVALPPDATQAAYESARAFVAGAAGFDPARTQDVTHAAATARAILDPAPPANDREGE